MNPTPEGSASGSGPNQDPLDSPDNSDHRGRKSRQNNSQDSQIDWAFIVQKACRNAIQKTKSRSANDSWALPLTAAPTVISIMALWLRLAGQEVIAGLEIQSQEVKNYDGTIMGSLTLGQSLQFWFVLDLTSSPSGLNPFPPISNTVAT